MADTSITCLRCDRTSYNPNDIEQGYCGFCHWWTSDPLLAAMMPTEFLFTCKLCGHREAWTTDAATKAASVWHVFDDHHDVWLEIAGGRDPVDPAPQTLGRRFEQWELQS